MSYLANMQSINDQCNPVFEVKMQTSASKGSYEVELTDLCASSYDQRRLDATGSGSGSGSGTGSGTTSQCVAVGMYVMTSSCAESDNSHGTGTGSGSGFDGYGGNDGSEYRRRLDSSQCDSAVQSGTTVSSIIGNTVYLSNPLLGPIDKDSFGALMFYAAESFYG